MFGSYDPRLPEWSFNPILGLVCKDLKIQRFVKFRHMPPD